MSKIVVFILLFLTYIIYSFAVYTKGTKHAFRIAVTEKEKIDKGKNLFQQYNCMSCHQLYGLGGYLGPELTTAWSDKDRGEAYIKAFLKMGGPRMPKYNFSDEEINHLARYLQYVDSTATTYKSKK